MSSLFCWCNNATVPHGPEQRVGYAGNVNDEAPAAVQAVTHTHKHTRHRESVEIHGKMCRKFLKSRKCARTCWMVVETRACLYWRVLRKPSICSAPFHTHVHDPGLTSESEHHMYSLPVRQPVGLASCYLPTRLMIRPAT